MKLILQIALSILLLSCNKSKFVKISGEVIHPTHNYVVFTKDKIVFDTIYLNPDNHFSVRIPVNKYNIYEVIYGPDSQYIYTEPNKELKLKIYSENFHEKLNFFGDFVEENTLLKKAFIKEMKNYTSFYEWYDLDYNTFKSKLDLLISEQNLEFNKLKQKPYSKSFLEVMEVIMLYTLHAKVEEYSWFKLHLKGSQLKIDPKIITENRKKINLKKDDLFLLEVYRDILFLICDNNALFKGYKLLSDNHTASALRTINQFITNPKLKESLSKELLIGFFKCKYYNSSIEKTVKTYEQINTEKAEKSFISDYLNDLNLAKKGDFLPKFELKNKQGIKINSLDLIKNNEKALVIFYDPSLNINQYFSKHINWLIDRNSKIPITIINLGDTKKFIKGLKTDKQYFLSEKNKKLPFLKIKSCRAFFITDGRIYYDYITFETNNFHDKACDFFEIKKQN